MQAVVNVYCIGGHQARSATTPQRKNLQCNLLNKGEIDNDLQVEKAET